MKTIGKESSKGIGDSISKALKALKIKECGSCAERRAALNRLIPYRKKG